MSEQEINLYRSFESPRMSEEFLTWKRLWVINSIVLIILLVIYIFSWIEFFQLQNTRTKLQTQVTALETKFNKIKLGYPPLMFSQNANESITQLEKDISTREKVLSTLTNPVAFSKILTAFGELIVPNVWLTQITLAKGGHEIVLKGNSIGMANLQRFLANIMQNPLFAGSILNINKIDKNQADKDKTEILTFEISIAKK